MTEMLRIATLALADSLNPIAIAMVLEALLAHRARKQSIIFAATTVIVNTVIAWLLIHGFDLISGLQQTLWPQVLIIAAGLALVGQGVYDAVKAHRHPEAKMRLWFSIADASSLKSAMLALVVSIALLPFGGQIIVAMLHASALATGALAAWGWALFYSALYTLPLWMLIAISFTPLSDWRPRSPWVQRYGTAVASMTFGVCLLALGLLS